MRTLELALGERSYSIHIGNGLLERGELILPALSGTDILVVTNETVAPLYLARFLAAMSQCRARSIVLPDGERFKNLEVLNTVFDALLESRFGRDCSLIALGGGVVGDITGFAAACYQRGVKFIQVPTTLLAQVDSSVGGKTGVNHALGKNMIGAFHQPSCVIADIDTLDTLPTRELRAGLAEVIKYALICDHELFAWLDRRLDRLLARDAESLSHVIERSCEIKAGIVSADERESGQRALLNLGHTFGHAIENALGYGEWLHGEAVAAGMCMAADLSARLGWLAPQERQRVRALIERAGLPTESPAQIGAERLLELMALDKKVTGGSLRLILLKSIGDAVICNDFDRNTLMDTLTACRSAA